MQVPHNAMIVVADGRKLLLLRNDGDGLAPNLTVEHAQEHPNPKDGDQASDLAGTAQSSRSYGGAFASGGSNVEQTDFHQLEEDRFAAETAELLKKRAFDQDYESLIIVAPPKTLGALRKHYHKEVKDRLKGELDKDLTGHSIPDIEKALIAAR